MTRAFAAVLGACLVALFVGSTSAAKTPAVGFGTPVYVDRDLAGGEPTVMADQLHGTLVYTSHEGTTHLYRDGLISSPWGDFSFVSNYCNQVNVWTSPDAGVNWFRDRYLGSPCPTSPAVNTGFSDNWDFVENIHPSITRLISTRRLWQLLVPSPQRLRVPARRCILRFQRGAVSRSGCTLRGP